MMNKFVIFGIIGISLIAFSCVPKKQFLELQEKNNVCMKDRDSLKSVNEEIIVKNTEMASEIEALHKKGDKLTSENIDLKDSVIVLEKGYRNFKTLYDDLLVRQETLIKGNDKEMRKLLSELQVTKEDLLKREDKLKDLEMNLALREKTLEKVKAEMEQKDKQLTILDSTLKIQQQELEARNSKLIEMEQILHSKDSAVQALKTKVTSALLGFENNGLSIQMKNGKVYVSLEEQLLFSFGKAEVDPKGIGALKKLAVVLEQNTDINIMIEGHTDDVGDAFYNWELSSKRANAIVKILLQNSKIDPKRLTAAGRGQYSPIDPAKTDDARRKNRRTEIILTPKLDELLKVLESN